MHRRLFLSVAALGLTSRAEAWGGDMHRLITRVAVKHLPADMPLFFTKAVARLEFLSYEPDEWRDREEAALGGTALNAGHDSDHIFKFEHYNPETLPPNRFDWLEDVANQGKDPRKIGTLPYRSMELFQRVRVAFRRWHRVREEGTRRFLESRIIDDSGILCHYIGDASMPMHMSINRNGWEEEENPEGLTRDNTFHSRFESRYAAARIREAMLEPYLREPKIVSQPLPYIHAHLRRSWEQLKPLYRLEKKRAFTPDNDSQEHAAFCAHRLADAASTIRDLWYTPFATSKPA